MISKGNFTSYAGFIFFLVLSGIVLQSRKSWMANYLIGVEMCVCVRARVVVIGIWSQLAHFTC